MGKDTYIYLKDDEALEEFKAKNIGKKYTVNYLKGLGELSEEETSILVDPEERIIKQITVEDVKTAEKLFDDLMGNAVVPRKKFIQEHSKEAIYHV
jgi:DNA gyrase subunit B